MHTSYRLTTHRCVFARVAGEAAMEGQEPTNETTQKTQTEEEMRDAPPTHESEAEAEAESESESESESPEQKPQTEEEMRDAPPLPAFSSGHGRPTSFGPSTAETAPARGLCTTRVVFFTDMEPDDVMAMFMVLNGLAQAHVLIVAGTENRCIDAPRVAERFARDALRDFGHRRFSIVVYDAARERERVRREVRLFDPDVIYLQKPLREYMGDESESEWTDKPLKARVFCYGSFNVRKMNPAPTETLARMRAELAGPFTFVESFDTIGTRNSVNVYEDPALFLEIQRSPLATITLLRELMMKWNLHIVRECHETLMKLLRPEAGVPDERDLNETHVWDASTLAAAKRNRHIIDSVQRGGIATQFVMADVLLPVVQANPEWRVSRVLRGFDENTKYPIWGEVEKGSTAPIFWVVHRDENAWTERRKVVVDAMIRAVAGTA